MDPVTIIYYTDPLDCWSWAFEPQWRRLRYEYEGTLQWTYRMCGLLPDWKSFSDPLNSVSRPLQMGPVWMEARHISGMPIDDKIWLNDPPSSSYPACVAVKCAGLQSTEAEEWYLRYIREAVMMEGKNIAKWNTLVETVQKLASAKPGLIDQNKLIDDLEHEAGDEPFRQDIQDARYRRITRYPSLTLHKPGQRTMLLTGYRPYSALLEALQYIAPELQPTRTAKDVEAYKAFWGELTDRELKEVAS